MSIVITGISVQSPLGTSFGECLDTMGRGVACVSDIENFDLDGFPMKAAGEVRSQGEVVRTPHVIDRKIHFLDITLTDVYEQANIPSRFKPSERILNVGCGVDYFNPIAYCQKKTTDREQKRRHAHNHAGGQLKNLAAKYQIDGGCHLFTAACVASTQAIGLSYRMLKHGIGKIMLTGGTESMTAYHSYAGFHLLGVMASGHESPTACKPFDKYRNGTVLGEGAIMITLENAQTALPGTIMAEIVGYGCTMDAYAITAPDPSAIMMAEAIRKALDDAGIAPEQIDCAHLHGTGTARNAIAEYQALRHIFGKGADELPVYSMKGQMGHLIAACGAMEMLGVIYSLRNQVVLPTVNYREKDPEAPLFVVKDKPLSKPIRYILKLNAAFGGQNTALILKKYQ